MASVEYTPVFKTFSLLARQIELAGGARLAPSTLFRWYRDGVKCPDGRVVKLRAVRCGRRLLSTDAWLVEFLDAQSDVADEPAVGPTVRSPAARRRASNRAAAELAARGVR